jgi:RNA polymerase sigma factor (sigma-70 family)
MPGRSGGQGAGPTGKHDSTPEQDPTDRTRQARIQIPLTQRTLTNVVQACPDIQSRDYGNHMRDSELVAAIVGGDPEGLAAAYDKYAARLYTYCRAVLHEPADAADAVQDTFVIAASRLDGLRDRDRLRPWLYAVARNECRRRIRARATTSALEEAPDVTDERADVAIDAERAELRTLVRAAVLGLNPAEQEVIELQLRQGLEGTEVADVLGITRNHAHALISRARDQLEVSLGVLLVARTGRQACPALDTLLESWDGELTTLWRKRLNRHVERCPVCSERKRSELRPAMLLGIAPLAALPLTAAAPPGLREQVLRLASSDTPDAVAHRASVAARTQQFGQHGFPKPLDPPKHWWQARPAQVTAAAVAAAAIIAATSVALSGGGRGPHHPEAAGLGAGAVPGATSIGPNAHPTGTGPGGVAPGVSPGSTVPGGTGGGGSGGGSSSSGAPGQPSPGSSVPGSSSGAPVPGGSSSAPGPGSSSPGRPSPGRSSAPPPSSRPPTPPPSSPAPPPPPPSSVAPGTLNVSPSTVVLSTLGGSEVRLTAVGGPVSWSIGEASSLIGSLHVAPSSGTLQAGQTASVTISVNGLASIDTVLTVSPGGHTITVILGLL